MSNEGTDKHEAFLTGSRCYGIPTEGSDWDLVVLMSADTAAQLGESPGNECKYDLHCSASTAFRFGILNLIVCFTEEEFENWRLARDKCLAEKPITRDRAIEIHKAEGAGRSKNIETPPSAQEKESDTLPSFARA